MTVDEMAAKVEKDLEEWAASIGVVAYVASPGRSPEENLEIGGHAAELAAWIILNRQWKKQAVEIVRAEGRIPESCESIHAMCHAMAHCLADNINKHLNLEGERALHCGNFSFMGHPSAAVGAVPITERIKFSHN